MTNPPARPGFDAAVLNRMGELIDRIMTIDIKGRGAVEMLYGAVRRDAPGPLALGAAQVLDQTIKRGDTAMLATGFPVRPWIDVGIGETDGPPGVAALARALSTGLGAVPAITTPKAMRAQLEQALIAAGVTVLDFQAAQRAVAGPRPTCCAAIIDYTTEPAEADRSANEAMARYRPVVLAAVEHPGANARGVYHSSVGVDISAGVARIEPLFALARAQSVPTFSFIDMANEVGTGALTALAHERIPFAKTCVCPCGSGMAGTSWVDHIVVGTTANWAAYACVAGLAILTGRPELAIGRAHDAGAIAAIMQHGGVEGVSGSIWPADGVDGISTQISGHIVELFAEVVANARHYQTGKPF